MRFSHERRAPRANDVLRWPVKITGLTKSLAGCLILAALSTTVSAGSVTLAWDPSTDSIIAGYNIYYGGASGAYTSSADVGANLTAEVDGLTPGLTYYFAVTAYDTNGFESVFSNEITNRLPILPWIIAQPLTQTNIAGAPVTLAVSGGGDPPLSFQWVNGLAPIRGATASLLSWPKIGNGNAGNYTVLVSNPWGSATSSVATLTVLPTNTIATAAGVYNGLFFQTNADGTPAVTQATAGFLGNCVVAGNGAFSAKVYVGGLSCSLAGVFDIFGNASATIPRTGAGLSNLTAVLRLDLINGTRQITGAISSTTAGNAWTAPLLGDRATNAFPQLAGVNLLVSPGASANSPTNFGRAAGFVVNGVLSLSGVLGDTAAFSQTVPISKDGNVPLFVSLYNGGFLNNSGLLEGWINLAGGVVTGNLTWIRPAGVMMPGGFPQGFNTGVQVTGVTFNH